MRTTMIERTMTWLKHDLVICVQNENGHIGSVVTGQPYVKNGQVAVTMNIFNVLGHQDDLIAKMYVEAAVRKFNCTVTCVCGIHLDEIVPEEIEGIYRAARDDIREMVHE